jgi:hypothetical protein
MSASAGKRLLKGASFLFFSSRIFVVLRRSQVAFKTGVKIANAFAKIMGL